ncbi:hypothetical protein ACMFMF_002242 [Clarireedia jacksonii]
MNIESVISTASLTYSQHKRKAKMGNRLSIQFKFTPRLPNNRLETKQNRTRKKKKSRNFSQPQSTPSHTYTHFRSPRVESFLIPHTKNVFFPSLSFSPIRLHTQENSHPSHLHRPG